VEQWEEARGEKRFIVKEGLIKFIKFKYSRNFTALKINVWMAHGKIRNIWKAEDTTDAQHKGTLRYVL
jgi:hypothetical protein